MLVADVVFEIASDFGSICVGVSAVTSQTTFPVLSNIPISELKISNDFVGQLQPSQSQRLFDHSLGSAVLMGFVFDDVQYVLGFGHMNDKYFSLETDRFLFDLLRLILSHMLTFLHRET